MVQFTPSGGHGCTNMQQQWGAGPLQVVVIMQHIGSYVSAPDVTVSMVM